MEVYIVEESDWDESHIRGCFRSLDGALTWIRDNTPKLHEKIESCGNNYIVKRFTGKEMQTYTFEIHVVPLEA